MSKSCEGKLLFRVWPSGQGIEIAVLGQRGRVVKGKHFLDDFRPMMLTLFSVRLELIGSSIFHFHLIQFLCVGSNPAVDGILSFWLDEQGMVVFFFASNVSNRMPFCNRG